jgi:hypothetical protein
VYCMVLVGPGEKIESRVTSQYNTVLLSRYVPARLGFVKVSM